MNEEEEVGNGKPRWNLECRSDVSCGMCCRLCLIVIAVVEFGFSYVLWIVYICVYVICCVMLCSVVFIC